MQLNQIPTQTVTGETTALEQQIAEQAVNAMPTEPTLGPFKQFVMNIPQPVVWLGGLMLALTLMARFGKR